QLAAVADMSPHYFAELFKMSTGYAPHRYVLLRRIERAKQKLRDSRHSILDVALDVGFQNPSHFARMFRKFVGTSPSHFQHQKCFWPSATALEMPPQSAVRPLAPVPKLKFSAAKPPRYRPPPSCNR